jgi:hypothetical protein
MTRPLTIQRTVHFNRQAHGRHRLDPGPLPVSTTPPPGRVPRVSRLMALAVRFERQVRTGLVPSYAELATLGHVTRARVSQIMNLANLAPDIQEALLHLPRTERGRDPIILRDLQPIASVTDWRRQRRLWSELSAARLRRPSDARNV